MTTVDTVQQTRSESATRLTEDELFTILANQRRRFVVYLLKRRADTSVSIGELADQIAAWENGIDLTEITGTHRKRVYTALQQSHLPKMAETGVIRFNRNRGTVEPTTALEEVDMYLDVIAGDEIPWSEYYLGLSGVAAALVAAVWLGVWPLGVVSELMWMAVVVIAFTVSATIHNYYSVKMELGRHEQPPELQSQN